MTDPIKQAEIKADAKVEADHKVATEPYTIHGVKRMLTAPGMIPSILVGAGVGALAVGGAPAIAIGAGVGYLAERHQIFGGPVGKIWKKIRGLV